MCGRMAERLGFGSAPAVTKAPIPLINAKATASRVRGRCALAKWRQRTTVPRSRCLRASIYIQRQRRRESGLQTPACSPPYEVLNALYRLGFNRAISAHERGAMEVAGWTCRACICMRSLATFRVHECVRECVRWGRAGRRAGGQADCRRGRGEGEGGPSPVFLGGAAAS